VRVARYFSLTEEEEIERSNNQGQPSSIQGERGDFLMGGVKKGKGVRISEKKGGKASGKLMGRKPKGEAHSYFSEKAQIKLLGKARREW